MASFKEAFRAARKSGKKVFSWNGKKYTTKLASEGKTKLPKTGPMPASKGDRATGITSERQTSNISVASRPEAKKAVTPAKSKDTPGMRGLKNLGKASAKLEAKVAESVSKASADASRVAANRQNANVGINLNKAKPKGEPINAAKYSPTPRAKQDMGDLSGPKSPPEKKKAAPAPEKKKTGPFGLGGLFKLGTGKTFK